MRDSIDELIDELIAREGGFVDHPADKGGPTRWGITQSVAHRHGYMGQMADLPRNVAALIYKNNIGAHLPSIKWHKSPRYWQRNYLTPASIWGPAQQSDFCNAR